MKAEQTNNMYTLLDNDLFIQWVLYPTEELDLYWREESDQDEELKKNINTLKNILERLNIEEPSLSSDEKMAIWNHIEKNTSEQKHKKSRFRKLYLTIASTAAIALIATGIFFTLKEKPIAIDYNSILTQDEIVMRSGNVSLIVSKDKVINIAKDSSVVAYDDKGRLNINSEEVEGDNLSNLNQLIVPYGKTTSVVLSDGTKIWVNSGSKLIYPSVFDKRKREVFVEGEIYLDVKRDEQAPFIIKTNHLEVNVLGTKFSVSAYTEDVQQSVVLVSGSVSVKNKEQAKDTHIIPNQMFSFNTTSKQSDIKTVDVENYISWINGYLLLHSENLNGVIQKLERHYNVTFAYDRNSFNDIRVSGKLDLKEKIEDVLNFISIATPINYDIKGNNIVITKKTL